MADNKISALTASSTPLAGTEVLPIVQSGATVNVSVANLTAGRAVSAASLALTTSPLPATSGGSGSSSSFVANAIPYASSTTTLTTASGLLFDGTNLLIGASSAAFGNGSGAIVQRAGTATLRINDSADARALELTADATGALISARGAFPMRFDQAGTEIARFDTSGNLLVTQTSSGVININGISLTGTSGSQAINHVNGTGSGSVYMYYGYNGATIGSITQNGTTGVLYNLTSDYRLKNNQETLTGAKDFIMALKPKKWQWWDGSGEGVGFVAHEFMEVAKYSGHGEKDAVETIEIKDKDGNITGTEERPVYQSIQPSSSEVMANLVAFIQEQSQSIIALNARVAALEKN
jgi:hypothetical protein